MRRLATLLSFALSLIPVAARAQVASPGSAPPQPVAPAPPAAPLPSVWERIGLHGVEIQIRGGVMLPNSASPVQARNLYPSFMGSGDPTGDILEGKESPYGPDPFGITVAAGYR